MLKLAVPMGGAVGYQADMVKVESLVELGYYKWVHFCISPESGGGIELISAGAVMREVKNWVR